HSPYPAEHEERAVFDVVVGMVVGDEDRVKRGEWYAGARILPCDAESAIENVGRALVQHDMRGHVARLARYWARAGAEDHQLRSLRILQRGAGFSDRCVDTGRLRITRRGSQRQRWCRSKRPQQTAAR